MINENSYDVKQLEGQLEKMDNTIRQKNVIIDGVPEEVETGSTPRGKIVEYIQKVLPNFKSSDIIACYRVGKLKKGKIDKPPVQKKNNSQHKSTHLE